VVKPTTATVPPFPNNQVLGILNFQLLHLRSNFFLSYINIFVFFRKKSSFEEHFIRKASDLIIHHHQGPLCRVDKVNATHALPSTWNVEVNGSKFITNDKLFEKIDTEMMDYVRVDNSLDLLWFSLFDMLLQFAIEGSDMLSLKQN